MQTISQQLEDLEQKIRRIEVSKDEFDNWKENKVTKRYLLECQYAMMLAVDLEESDGAGDTMDRVALVATYRKAVKETYEDIISWNPEEFSE